MFEPNLPPMNAQVIYHTGRIEPNYPNEVEARAQFIADRTGKPCQFMRDVESGEVETAEPTPNPYNPIILDSGRVIIAPRLIDAPPTPYSYSHYKHTPGTILPADTDPENVSWEVYRKCYEREIFETECIADNRGAQTLREAAYDYATPYAFGYGTAVITDGMILCSNCFADTISQSDPADRATEYRDYVVTSLDSSPSTGTYCDGEHYIPGAEPYCVDCGDPEDDTRESYLWHSDSTDTVLCGPCLGEAVQRGEAERVHPDWLPADARAYEVTPNRTAYTGDPRQYAPQRGTQASRGTYYRY